MMFACLATAHTRSQSFSSWYIQEDGQVRLAFSIQALEATRLRLLADEPLDLPTLLVNHLRTHIAVYADGDACHTVAGPRSQPARAGYLRAEWRFACPAGTPVTILHNAFFPVASSHVHYARVRTENGPPVEYLFTASERRRVIPVRPPRHPMHEGILFFPYIVLGIEHIVVGVDHIAFLFALLLLCRRVREVVLMVSGFTVGHSVTLSLAVLGVVKPQVAVIEALIGYTIALVAAENVGVTHGANTRIALVGTVLLLGLTMPAWSGKIGLPVITLVGLALFTVCYFLLVETQTAAARVRPLLTVVFGLIHGFGFASVLMEMGLPPGRLVPALLGFNIGVEVGQLAIVAGLWALGVGVVRFLPTVSWQGVLDAASAGLCGLGAFWFIGRALGG
ncbi:MAG: HupE/UreJ family protein [Candidatus Binatia bacterium]|nr:HupE/UreJ family protein [Candidatus Binatia bacterium]